MIDDLAQNWLEAKSAEQAATERRRDIEDKLLSLAGIAENMEGTENVETDGGYKIKITGRMGRKVDADRIQDIAAEEGSSEHLSRCWAGLRQSPVGHHFKSLRSKYYGFSWRNIRYQRHSRSREA